ncbi:MAG: hypothetical protein Q8R13_01300 [bacterium]|nr:hypothetical protein [bacterium]
MDERTPITALIIAVVALAVGAGGGYYYGAKVGYEKGDVAGYERAGADLSKVREEAARKAAEEAAKTANPFQAVNPLEGIETDPFVKTKQVLNPFE